MAKPPSAPRSPRPYRERFLAWCTHFEIMSSTSRGEAVEQLVAAIEEALSERASVRHDERLVDRVTGRKRQVDVLVEFRDGHHVARYMYEVKCHRRPIGTGTVEQTHRKKEDLGVEKAVLVSASGFTRPAEEKAKFLRISLMRLDLALERPFSWLARYVENLRAERIDIREWSLGVEESPMPLSRQKVDSPGAVRKAGLRVRTPEGQNVTLKDLMDPFILNHVNGVWPENPREPYEFVLKREFPGHYLTSPDLPHPLRLAFVGARVVVSYSTQKIPLEVESVEYRDLARDSPLAEVARMAWEVDGHRYQVDVIGEPKEDGSTQIQLLRQPLPRSGEP